MVRSVANSAVRSLRSFVYKLPQSLFIVQVPFCAGGCCSAAAICSNELQSNTFVAARRRPAAPIHFPHSFSIQEPVARGDVHAVFYVNAMSFDLIVRHLLISASDSEPARERERERETFAVVQRIQSRPSVFIHLARTARVVR